MIDREATGKKKKVVSSFGNQSAASEATTSRTGLILASNGRLKVLLILGPVGNSRARGQGQVGLCE